MKQMTIEDRQCDVCGEFCESVAVYGVAIGCYKFDCTNCGEEVVYFTNEEY